MGVHMSICPPVHLPVLPSIICLYFCFGMITWVNVNGFSPNLVCALILWRSGLGLLMGWFCQLLTEVSAVTCLYFHYRTKTSKYQWIFTKLGMCIYIVEICLRLLMGNFLQYLTELSACDKSSFLFQENNLSKSQWIFTKLDKCIDIVQVWFGIANGQILSIFERFICPRHDDVREGWLG